MVFLFRLSVREEAIRRAFLSRGGRNLFFRPHFENALLPYKWKRRGEEVRWRSPLLDVEGQNGRTRMNVTLFSIVCRHLEEHTGV